MNGPASSDARERPVVQSPLLPVALAVTAGIMLDRYAALPVSVVAAAVLAGFVGWSCSLLKKSTHVGVACLLLVAGGLGAAWHHFRHVPALNDVGHFATEDGQIVRLRGVILENAVVGRSSADDSLKPLRSRPLGQTASTLLETVQLWQDDRWIDVSGTVKLFVASSVPTIKAGEGIELVGSLSLPAGPGNPGEHDLRQYYADQGLSGSVQVKGEEAVSRFASPQMSFNAALWQLREWSGGILREMLPEDQWGIASALFLGDQTAISAVELDSYLRTGVFHVLAISGQHLVILCGGAWWLLRRVGFSWRRAACVIPWLAVSYGFLAGFRPSVLRAVVIVCVFAGAAIVRRRAQPINSLALAWLIVIVFNPADIFRIGCLLSFLSVLVIYQVFLPVYPYRQELDQTRSQLLRHPVLLRLFPARDDLERLVYESRTLWQRAVIQVAGFFVWSFFGCLVIWLASAPLIAANGNLVSPIAVPLGPFVILLISIALLAGFPMLILGGLSTWLSTPFVWIVEGCLMASNWLVGWSNRLAAGYWYVSGLPSWWLWVFYVGLLAALKLASQRPATAQLKIRPKPAIAAGLAWLAVGLFANLGRPPTDELRCTFLSVGHGSCAVLEMPDGRVLLYDAGSLAGPEVTARQIAPYLWSRGISRIDEVCLSHADLDHFNGLPALLDRFAVSQVSMTPSFAYKAEGGVQLVMETLAERKVVTRTLWRGRRLQAGDVLVDVLHPPPQGPAGPENARSMVLLVTYRNQAILLTGDLEPPGLEQVLQLPLPMRAERAASIDVVMAPHHGSQTSNTAAFADWARPGLVVSSEGRPRGKRPDPYTHSGSSLWRTWEEGAVTIWIGGGDIRAETFRTNRKWSRRAGTLAGRGGGAETSDLVGWLAQADVPQSSRSQGESRVTVDCSRPLRGRLRTDVSTVYTDIFMSIQKLPETEKKERQPLTIRPNSPCAPHSGLFSARSAPRAALASSDLSLPAPDLLI